MRKNEKLKYILNNINSNENVFIKGLSYIYNINFIYTFLETIEKIIDPKIFSICLTKGFLLPVKYLLCIILISIMFTKIVYIFKK